MRSHILLIAAITLLICFSSEAKAQITFERTYGGQFYDAASEVLETPDHGFLIFGTTRSVSNDTTDAWLIRTDSRGDTLWTRTYGGDDFDSGVSMTRATDGGYVLGIASKSIRPGNYEIYLVRIDEQGDVLWTQTYGGPEYEYVHSIQATDDGGYIVFAYTISYGAGSRDFYLMKVNQSGDSLWARTYGGAGMDLGSTVLQTADGGYLLTGYTESFLDPTGDVYLVRTDAFGDTLWTRTYGEEGYDRANHVLATQDGGFLLVGITQSLGEASENGLLIKTDAQGAVEWMTVFGDEHRNSFAHARQLPNGDYIVVGGGASGTTNDYDVYLVRFDSEGDALWTRYFGGEESDGGTWVLPTSDGGFAVVGRSESFVPDHYYDLYFLKTDGDGLLSAGNQQQPLPPSCILHQNYPNPFNPGTTISFELARPLTVSLIVTDALGREVARLVDNESRNAGSHSVLFDARALPSAVYFYRLMVDDNEARIHQSPVLHRKMILLQ